MNQAEDIAHGPDPATEDDVELTETDQAEVDRLLVETPMEDWNGHDDDTDDGLFLED